MIELIFKGVLHWVTAPHQRLCFLCHRETIRSFWLLFLWFQTYAAVQSESQVWKQWQNITYNYFNWARYDVIGYVTWVARWHYWNFFLNPFLVLWFDTIVADSKRRWGIIKAYKAKQYCAKFPLIDPLVPLTPGWSSNRVSIRLDNGLLPNGQHWFRKWLVTYSTPSHYLNHCIDVINWTLGNKLQWKSNQNKKYFHSEKCIWKHRLRDKAAILSIGRWVHGMW